MPGLPLHPATSSLAWCEESNAESSQSEGKHKLFCSCASQDLDNSFLHKTELEAKLIGLHAMVELMKNIYEQVTHTNKEGLLWRDALLRGILQFPVHSKFLTFIFVEAFHIHTG